MRQCFVEGPEGRIAHNTLAFAQDNRIVGGIVISLWVLQYVLLAVLAVALIVEAGRIVDS